MKLHLYCSGGSCTAVDKLRVRLAGGVVCPPCARCQMLRPRPWSSIGQEGTGYLYGAEQVKLAASFESPVPLYFATRGYAQTGMVRSTPLPPRRVAVTEAGATPFSTHSTIDASSAIWSSCGPSLPRQKPTFGPKNAGLKWFVPAPWGPVT